MYRSVLSVNSIKHQCPCSSCGNSLTVTTVKKVNTIELSYYNQLTTRPQVHAFDLVMCVTCSNVHNTVHIPFITLQSPGVYTVTLHCVSVIIVTIV